MNKHLFPYEWNLADGFPASGMKKNNIRVFGTFICGGGSTMGYKLAGCTHLGGVEIDKKVGHIYTTNHKPKLFYNEDIRDFNNRDDLPDELFNLDILDGSPPCSTFSMAGNREDDWGKERQFNEGQKLQTLDDLVFAYCDTIIKLKPKVAILENVKGLAQGNARAYLNSIVNRLKFAGYTVQIFLLNSASMGVPQRRERVFVIARQTALNLQDIQFKFNEPGIMFRHVFDASDTTEDLTDYQLKLWKLRRKTDKCFGHIIGRTEDRLSMFSNPIIHLNEVCPTLTSSAGVSSLWNAPRNINKIEFGRIGTFPADYNYLDVDPKYLIGMSVPPVMIAQIANQINIQWFSKIGKHEKV